jgi:hypothetical protein
MDDQRTDREGGDRLTSRTYEIPARVIYVSSHNTIQILLGPDYRMLDGGVPTDIQLELVPFELRMPNTELVVMMRDGYITAVRRNDGSGSKIFNPASYSTIRPRSGLFLHGRIVGMEKLSRAAGGWLVIVIGCCIMLGTAVMLYRGDVGHVIPITRKNDPIFFWSEIAIFFAFGAYIVRLGIYTLSRKDDGEN